MCCVLQGLKKFMFEHSLLVAALGVSANFLALFSLLAWGLLWNTFASSG